jgi:hypothetical protein
MTMTAHLRLVPDETAVAEKTALLGWLRLLGWTVVIDGAGSRWAGFAWRTGSLGYERCISESADSHRELVSKLLSSARSYVLQAA